MRGARQVEIADAKHMNPIGKTRRGHTFPIGNAPPRDRQSTRVKTRHELSASPGSSVHNALSLARRTARRTVPQSSRDAPLRRSAERSVQRGLAIPQEM
ncbi:hypothetical protein PSP6_60169 [Paraburkholderia tropica]|nr:hypothetical protein PSP6_60169 [Paraburkholderia tropica]